MKHDKAPPTAGDVTAEHEGIARRYEQAGGQATAADDTPASGDQAPHDQAPHDQAPADQAEPAAAPTPPASQSPATTPEPTGSHAPTPPAEPEPAGPSRRARAGDAARRVGRGASWVRTKVAQVIWLIAVACAVVLGVGALLVALDANADNALVAWVLDRAGDLDGPFFDIFTFSGDDAAKKQLLVGWALAAVAYLVVGRIVERVVKP